MKLDVNSGSITPNKHESFRSGMSKNKTSKTIILSVNLPKSISFELIDIYLAISSPFHTKSSASDPFWLGR